MTSSTINSIKYPHTNTAFLPDKTVREFFILSKFPESKSTENPKSEIPQHPHPTKNPKYKNNFFHPFCIDLAGRFSS